MHNKFRLSIVIPNYNYEDFVAEAINSALSIDWPDLEVIVVDDGSTDKSRSVIECFKDKVRVIYQPNSSQRVACNAGFASCTGDVVLFLDSDDMLDASIGKEIASVWNQNVSKIQFQMLRVDRDGISRGSVFPSYNPLPTPVNILRWELATSSYPTAPGSGNVYSRTFLEKIFPLDSACGSFSDTACIAAAPFFGDVVTVRKPLVFYRVHGNNDSALLKSNNNFAREVQRAIDRHYFALKFDKIGAKHAENALFRNLTLLQFRVASLVLDPNNHPLLHDSCVRTLSDAVLMAFKFSAAKLRFRLVVLAWTILTICSPRKLSRKLIYFRYRQR